MRLTRKVGPLRLVTLAPSSDGQPLIAPALFQRLMQLVFASLLSRQGFRLRWPSIGAHHSASDLEALLAIARTENRRAVPVAVELRLDPSLIESAWIDLFRRHDVKLELLLDGPAPLHNYNRRGVPGLGSFAASERGIERLRAANIPFDVSARVTHRSLDHARELLPLFAELGARSVGFDIACEACDAAHPCDRDETWDEFWRDVVLSGSALTREMPVREVGEAFLRYAGDHSDVENHFIPLRLLTCDGEGRLSTFSPELLSAPTRGKFVFGTVERMTRLEGLLDSIALHRCREDIAAGVAACEASCGYFGACGGGEPAQKLREHGSLRASETRHCRRSIQAPARLTLAMTAALSAEAPASEADRISP